METRILGLDIAGNPFKWLTMEEAVHYYASDKVVWDIGEELQTFRGGVNKHGERSEIVTKSIIAIKGETKRRFDRETINTHGNYLLFRRDHHVCAFCGDEFEGKDLTRDHVHPRSRGGSNAWENSVTACKTCNERKSNRTPEEANMLLLYLPYKPCRWEHFILQNRNVIADQMDYLKSKLPKHSRYS
jgi:CRISPR/Cas system Type II protein with McrA/HNH and RuvC-like nuclease domain